MQRFKESRQLKILLVIDQYDEANNGTTISAQRFAQTLRRHGNEVRVVCTGQPGADKYIVPKLYIPIADKIIKGQGITLAKPDKEVLYEAIRWADVVHLMMPFWLAKTALKIAVELDVPHTAAFHIQPENISYTLGIGRVERVNKMIYRFFRNTFYDQIGHIHCPSRFIASEMQRNGYTSNLHVISNGVDPGFRYRKLPKKQEWQDKFVIMMVGRLSNEKRQDVLIEAVKQSRYKDRIQVALAGRGPNEAKYRERAKELKNEIDIGFYSEQELQDILAMTDLYVHAADVEIEAISCIEAFSSGLVPIIANSPKSATPQFALDERSLFEAGNSADLAAKIDYWVEHEQQRRDMELAYADYGKEFGIDKCVEKTEDMFWQAIDEKTARVYVYPRKVV